MKAIIKSNTSFAREYSDIGTRSALIVARKYGRCEYGEIVEVMTNKGKVIDAALYDPGSKEYYRVFV